MSERKRNVPSNCTKFQARDCYKENRETLQMFEVQRQGFDTLEKQHISLCIFE